MLLQSAGPIRLADPERVYFSPGRVNLIGEHLDYNGGHVMPCAIDLGNTFRLASRSDDIVRAASGNFSRQGIYEFRLSDIERLSPVSWQQYLIGSLRTLIAHGAVFPHGFELLVEGNLPGGAGLSSSASVVTGYLYSLNDRFGFGFSKLELALMAKEVENRHIGVNCGIMDMYAILFGREDHLVYLDTQAITHELVPLELGEYQLVISNTNKKRSLQSSDYNERRDSCELVARAAGKPLAELSLAELDALGVSELARKRARYVILEEKRTRQARAALHQGDIKAFGRLMDQSHHGLKEEFEVTGRELDALAQACRDFGAIGSRMTGAGFGGCVVSLFPKSELSEVLARVSDHYQADTGLTPDHYLVRAAGGTSRRSV
ncbi:MAG TPA: galactokinase [Tissierellia bacterium]|nr:galactokinase [Tissierellia bacterium]